jgi:SulP family sulfate permease
MLVALPSSIAYGVAIYTLLGADYVGHGVRAGILGAIAIGLVAPLLGGAPRLISAPSAPAAAVLAALATEMLAGLNSASGPVAPGRIVVLLTLVGLLSGCLQFLYGLIGGGRLIKYIPFPVVAGYLSGVGVIIFLSQAPKFLGLPKDVSLGTGLLAPGLWQWPALVVGAVTIAGMLLAPKLTKAVPATIFGLLGGLIVYFGLGLFLPELLHLAHNKLVIGPVGGGAGAILAELGARGSALAALHWSDWTALAMPALTLSVLLSIDTLKTCVVVEIGRAHV